MITGHLWDTSVSLKHKAHCIPIIIALINTLNNIFYVFSNTHCAFLIIFSWKSGQKNKLLTLRSWTVVDGQVWHLDNGHVRTDRGPHVPCTPRLVPEAQTVYRHPTPVQSSGSLGKIIQMLLAARLICNYIIVCKFYYILCMYLII